jgi:cysteine desulfurase
MSDATQAVGKIKVDVNEQSVDLMAFSGHKFYGPKGIGALYIRRKKPRVSLSPLIDGGGHERGFRSGTLNVPGIVGMGKAAEIAMEEMPGESARLENLRIRIESELLKMEQVYLNGDSTNRLPAVSNLSFRYIEGEVLVAALNRFLAISTGSACTSVSLEPSHVLSAMNVPPDLIDSSLRFCLGRFTKDHEIDYTIEKVRQVVADLRASSMMWEAFKKDQNA